MKKNLLGVCLLIACLYLALYAAKCSDAQAETMQFDTACLAVVGDSYAYNEEDFQFWPFGGTRFAYGAHAVPAIADHIDALSAVHYDNVVIVAGIADMMIRLGYFDYAAALHSADLLAVQAAITGDLIPAVQAKFTPNHIIVYDPAEMIHLISIPARRTSDGYHLVDADAYKALFASTPLLRY